MKLHSPNRIRMALSAIVVTAAAVLPLQATAQDLSDSHLAAARSALSALKATEPFDNILLGTAEGLKTRLISTNPDLEGQISDIVDSETLSLVSRRADLENEAARVYASAFSEEELNEIAAFYNTEAGQKLIENGPIVAREVGGAAKIWARGIDRDLLELVIARMNEAGLRANLDGATVPAPEGTPAQGTEGEAPQN